MAWGDGEMDEPLYKNETKLDRNPFYFALAAYYKAMSGRIVLLIIGILFAAWFIGSSWTEKGVQSAVVSAVYAAGILAYCIFNFFRGHWIRANQEYRAFQRVFPNGRFYYTFYADHFEETTPAITFMLDYRKVKSAVSVKNAFVLNFVNEDQKDQMAIMSRTGFTQGTEQDAWEFLRQKCVNARFYTK